MVHSLAQPYVNGRNMDLGPVGLFFKTPSAEFLRHYERYYPHCEGLCQALTQSCESVYPLKADKSACMSSGKRASNDICSPVAGCSKPSSAACSACLGNASATASAAVVNPRLDRLRRPP